MADPLSAPAAPAGTEPWGHVRADILPAHAEALTGWRRSGCVFLCWERHIQPFPPPQIADGFQAQPPPSQAGTSRALSPSLRRCCFLLARAGQNALNSSCKVPPRSQKLADSRRLVSAAVPGTPNVSRFTSAAREGAVSVKARSHDREATGASRTSSELGVRPQAKPRSLPEPAFP